jgi:hypothetical protein
MRAQPGLDEVDRDAIVLLLTHAERAYQRSKSERAMLHQQEWDASSRDGSVLGEAEMRTDAVFGVARELLRVRVDFASRDILERAAIFRSGTLQKWLHDDGPRFPEFAAYLAAVEHLRALAFRIIVSASST